MAKDEIYEVTTPGTPMGPLPSVPPPAPFLNRAAKRKQMKAAKGQAKQKFTLLELQKAFSIALEMKQESRGHLFSKTLKRKEDGIELCVFCGTGRDTTEGECKYSLLTFVDRVQTILLNPTFFVGDDSQANYLQHGDEYEGIRIPVEAKE